MKQVLQNLRNGKISVEDIPTPQARPGSALVQNAFSLVSAGTERMLVEFAEKSLVGKAQSRPDLVRQMLNKASREGIIPTIQSAFNRLDQPMVLGYSSAGTIIEVGTGLEGFHPGDRVACAGSGYAVHAEFVNVPKNLLVKLPDVINFEEAAFTTLGSIAMHGFRLAEPQLGERVGVIGLGLLGLLAAQIAHAAGCTVLGIEPNPDRRAIGQNLGIETCTLDQASEKVQQISSGMGLDIILICADTSSSEPVMQAAELARDRGRVIALGAVGMNIVRKPYYEKELVFRVSRSYGPGRYDQEYEEQGRDYPAGYVRWTEQRNMQAFIDLLAAKLINVKPLISHIFSIESAPKAYELIANKEGIPYLGILMQYPVKTEGLSSRRITFTEATPTVSLDQAVAGVLGAGNYAQAVFLPMLAKAKNTRLHTIVSGSGVTATQAAKKYQFSYASSDEQDVLAKSEVNTVVVLTQHNHHARQVVQALQNGKNVYCEKPLALTMTELEEIFAQLKPEGPRLTVGFNRRFSPLGQQMKAFLQVSDQPMMLYYRVNAGLLPSTHWLHDPARGGGRLLGEGCHFIDFLTYLVGDSPIAIDVHVLPAQGDIPADNASIRLYFPDGSIGNISYLSNGDRSFPKEICECFVGGRIAILDDFRQLTMIHDGKKRVEKSTQDKGHRQSWDAFVDSLLRGSKPPITYTQLWSVSQAAILAAQAAQSGEKLEIKPFEKELS
jgi:predicted dehydrogenase/threonine dehydrogenase-like Zn-dependent dehydrogenase